MSTSAFCPSPTLSEFRLTEQSMDMDTLDLDSFNFASTPNTNIFPPSGLSDGTATATANAVDLYSHQSQLDANDQSNEIVGSDDCRQANNAHQHAFTTFQTLDPANLDPALGFTSTSADLSASSAMGYYNGFSATSRPASPDHRHSVSYDHDHGMDQSAGVAHVGQPHLVYGHPSARPLSSQSFPTPSTWDLPHTVSPTESFTTDLPNVAFNTPITYHPNLPPHPSLIPAQIAYQAGTPYQSSFPHPHSHLYPGTPTSAIQWPASSDLMDSPQASIAQPVTQYQYWPMPQRMPSFAADTPHTVTDYQPRLLPPVNMTHSMLHGLASTGVDLVAGRKTGNKSHRPRFHAPSTKALAGLKELPRSSGKSKRKSTQSTRGLEGTQEPLDVVKEEEDELLGKIMGVKSGSASASESSVATPTNGVDGEGDGEDEDEEARPGIGIKDVDMVKTMRPVIREPLVDLDKVVIKVGTPEYEKSRNVSEQMRRREHAHLIEQLACEIPPELHIQGKITKKDTLEKVLIVLQQRKRQIDNLSKENEKLTTNLEEARLMNANWHRCFMELKTGQPSL